MRVFTGKWGVTDAQHHMNEGDQYLYLSELVKSQFTELHIVGFPGSLLRVYLMDLTVPVFHHHISPHFNKCIQDCPYNEHTGNFWLSGLPWA